MAQRVLQFFLMLIVAAMTQTIVAADNAHSQSPLQKAFTESFHIRLDDYDNPQSATSETVEPTQKITLKNLNPPPVPFFFNISQTSWQIAFGTAAFALAMLLLDVIAALHTAYHAPQRTQRRQARKTIRNFLDAQQSSGKQHHTNGLLKEANANLDDAIQALRLFFNLPPGATLMHIADEARNQNFPQLAEACRCLHEQRFANINQTDALPDFTRAIKRLLCLIVPAILCLAFADSTPQEWLDAQKHAEKGNLQQAFKQFLDLTHTPYASPELSENLATILAVLPTPVDSRAETSRDAWLLHAKLQRNARKNMMPECLLPILPILLAATMITFRRKHLHTACLCLGMALLATTVLFATTTPRRNLAHHAIVAANTTLRTTPDTQATPSATIGDEPQCVTLHSDFPATNGWLFVSTPESSGWCQDAQLIMLQP